jgi:glucose-6-phosphate isomerase
VIEITKSGEWQALRDHFDGVSGLHLREMFAGDVERVRRMTIRIGDLYVDFSKHRVVGETVELLHALARRAGLGEAIEAMFTGRHINTSEDRAVLHTALRLPREASLVVDGQDVVADVHAVLDSMGRFSDQVRSGAWRGATGKRIRTVVNIGIGGSDLGPAMAYEALKAYADAGVACRFVSNLDPADLLETTRDLDPAETLFIVCSKTFTTLETLANARAARQWVLTGLGTDEESIEESIARHFVAVSTNEERVREFGIDPSAMFGFWDWVGGRYSVDSAVGLALMCAIGRTRFEEFLGGLRAVDEHFRAAPLGANAPAMLGLLGVWYTDFFGAQAKAVLPYSQYLRRFPAYLQQLTMESNGKSVRADGAPVGTQTGEIYWGEPGTNGQHAFYQLLHQGTHLVPADFIGFANPIEDVDEMHDLLMANFFAQSAVLAFGQTPEEVAAAGVPAAIVPHRTMPGNRPSTTILATRLTPAVLGQLIALYEHTVFTEGVIWGLDSFDQWGVELGKVAARRLVPALSDQRPPEHREDRSTDALIEEYRRGRDRAV